MVSICLPTPTRPRGYARRIYWTGDGPEPRRLWRDAPGFSQRFTGTFADRGDTIAGHWRLCRDDITWNDDLQITYRRQP